MSVLTQPWWPELRPLMRVQVYGRDGGPLRPRFRLEVTLPANTADQWFAVTMPCVACGRPIQPIRQRVRWETAYFTPTCSLLRRLPCSRGKAARDEYLAVRAALDAAQAHDQPSLFQEPSCPSST